MELEHSFTIPVSAEQAWEVLLDVERVAPCMPGATIDGVDGDVISGRIKVKVGPIALTYAGKARFTEKDEQARMVALEASGKETRGTGTASATVRSTLQDLGGQTRVTVHTTMNITGRPAQFGRGVMVEVGGKIIEKFAANLAAQLASGGPAAELAPGGPAAELAPGGPAVTAGEEHPGDVTLLPIEELNLPVRSYNSLRRQGVHTVGALASRNEKDLLAIDGLGPQSVKEIKQKLADHGLTLDSAGAPAAGEGSSGPAADGAAADGAAADGAAADGAAADGAAAGATTQGLNGSRPTAAAPPSDDDAMDLLSVAGLPILKRALPGIGLLVGLLVLLVARSRRKRRRAREASN
jgi:carbon monoxide dehydrogenase subunit G